MTKPTDNQLAEAGLRYYADSGQTIAIAIWTDGTSTTGDPSSTHMQALLARAKREGTLWPYEPACPASQPQQLPAGYHKLLADKARAELQRDELLAALRDIVSAAQDPNSVAEVAEMGYVALGIMKFAGRIESVAQAAIARAEGRAE